MADVNERIDKLKQEASDLRKEVRDLKGKTQQLVSYYYSFITYFPNTHLCCCFRLDTLQQQNELIISLLTKQNDLLKRESRPAVSVVTSESSISQVLYGQTVSEIIRRFPLESLEHLEKYESDLNDENIQQNVSVSLVTLNGI